MIRQNALLQFFQVERLNSCEQIKFFLFESFVEIINRLFAINHQVGNALNLVGNRFSMRHSVKKRC